ncbi:hypothetical protein [Wenzhouxiangella sp. EGI_FJ10409]
MSADPGWIHWLRDGARRRPTEECGDDFDPEEFSVSQARHLKRR